MTTGLPAWVAICAVVAAQALPVRAQPAGPTVPTGPTGEEEPAVANEPKRQVAVIDLTDDLAVSELSTKIWTGINQSDELMIPNKRDLNPFLTGRLFDEDSDAYEGAENRRREAQRNIDDANMSNATTQASRGEQQLADLFPTASGRLLYAELAMIDGLALLDEGRVEEASWAMALAHRLDSTRVLDPASYPPDTVKIFNIAIAAKPKQVAVELTGSSGRVWIDYVERGNAPGSFDVEVGEHVITVTGDDRLTTSVMPRAPRPTKENHPTVQDAQSPVVKRPITIVVPEAPADEAVQVQRARLALSKAQAIHDDVGRANAMNRIAKLVGVGDAIMISKRPDGKLQWETWRDRAPGFSAPKQWLEDQKPAEILDTIAPPHRSPPRRFQPPPQQPPFQPPLPAEQEWYEKGWVQISGASAVILAVVGVILLATRDRPITFDGDVKVRQ